MDMQKKVAEVVQEQVRLSAKSVEQIAEEAGMSPGALRLACEGRIKVPINRVTQLATALGLQPKAFIELVMSDYMPESWAVLREALRTPDPSQPTI